MATDTESTREAFGLDLSGFTNRSGLAFARRNGRSIEFHLIKDHPLDVNVAERKRRWSETEAAFIKCLVGRAPVYVDVPIDLQELHAPDQVVTAWWQLTMRPVDKILDGLAPLASFLGVPVARFRRICREYPGIVKLGGNVFETYPAASISFIDEHGTSYKKGRIRSTGNGWKATREDDHSEAQRDARMMQLAVQFELVAQEDETELDDDALDAIICALTGVVDPDQRCEGNELSNRLRHLADDNSLEREIVTAPRGYVLLCQLPEGEKSVWQHESYDDLLKCIT